MGRAKDIVVKPIDSKSANTFVRHHHYSGKVVNNSQLHLGAFLDDKLHGVMQFGPSLDKSKIIGLVEGTGWNEFIELNRLAFDDSLPKNSESRCISVAMRLIRKYCPHVKWVISFADGAQCGDGTIYRASGFVLTGIKRNTSIWEAPDGGDNAAIGATVNRIGGQEALRRARFSRTSLTDGKSKAEQAKAMAVLRDTRTTATKGKYTSGANGGASMKPFIEAGFRPLPGYQLRYLYFLDPTARERLTVPILPFSEIEKRGAKMYKGQRIIREVETPTKC